MSKLVKVFEGQDHRSSTNDYSKHSKRRGNIFVHSVSLYMSLPETIINENETDTSTHFLVIVAAVSLHIRHSIF